MPAKGTTRVTGSQRLAIAHGKIAGKTAAEIAADTGLAPVTVDKTEPRSADSNTHPASQDRARGATPARFRAVIGDYRGAPRQRRCIRGARRPTRPDEDHGSWGSSAFAA